MDVVSTAEVPANERVDFWRDVSSKLWVPYELGCERDLENNFQAEIGVTGFGPVTAALMTSTRHTVRRAPKHIRQSDPEVFKLVCVERGGGRMTQEGRCTEFGVGDLVLFDTSRPFQAEFLEHVSMSRLLFLVIPRPLLPLPRDLRSLSATRIPGARGVGALTSQFMLQLARRLDELSPAAAARMTTLSLDVLNVALADALDAGTAVPPHTRQRALMARIHAFIRDNLGDTWLTPAAIAAAHHISLRYLHKLFQQEGHTVAGWVRERRLERCRRDLADPQLAARPINAIAARWGFTSPAHFSQAFRDAYGVPPRQFRQECVSAPTVRAH
ncbi:helix-turn-helix domain-containing protein [Streptomyces pakalii]|uniref:Helix-turn-helix domain-containing protein n=1 Tax=Streptomyces pakalii TaxID=3036494 RepID=A0ABT7DLP2_9ACTN|nr:helix-turn-helix domain-containing protein [Streptomyces pakalii]MDJ1645381.1 helix-turn-helix domain-containing protein [Streptomyces pakalii]